MTSLFDVGKSAIQAYRQSLAVTGQNIANMNTEGYMRREADLQEVSGSQGGITSLADYTISVSGDYIILTDSSSNTIQFKNIETLTVGSYTYVEDTSDDTYWNSTEKVLYTYDGGNTDTSLFGGVGGDGPLSGFSA